MEPTAAQLTAFLAFIRGVMGIPTTALPDASPAIAYALTGAVNLVNLDIQTISPFLYDQALNNLAGDNLLCWTADQTGQTFFADARKAYGINNFVPGVVQSSEDESTSETQLVPDFFKTLTLSNLQNLKTPYGRQYLAIAQDYGTLWGLT